jgi:hypothetical protein
MPKRPRVFVESGIYHVYNRFALEAELLGRWPEAVSRWASRGPEMRINSEDFRADYERLDQALASERIGRA